MPWSAFEARSQGRVQAMANLKRLELYVCDAARAAQTSAPGAQALTCTLPKRSRQPPASPAVASPSLGAGGPGGGNQAG